MKRILVSFALLLSSALAAPAAEEPVKARVDFLLRDGIEVEVLEISPGGEATEAAWGGSRTLVSLFPTAKTRQSASITLKADRMDASPSSR